MRRSLLAVVVAVATPGPIVSVAAAETVVAQETATFPLPKDAVAQRGASKKSPDTRIAIYDVARSRDAVVTEARGALKAGGWEVLKDEPSPSGNAVRLTVKKSGKTWKASFTGDDKQAVIIVTAPS
jgi:hypothetical protein